MIKKIIAIVFTIIYLIIEIKNGNADIIGNYVGGNLIYNSAVLNSINIRKGGWGIEFFYNSYFSSVISYKICFLFLYNTYNQER